MGKKAFDVLERVIDRKRKDEVKLIELSRKEALKREYIKNIEWLKSDLEERFEKFLELSKKTKELLGKYKIAEADEKFVEDLIEISEDYTGKVQSASEPGNLEEQIELDKELMEMNRLFGGGLTEDYEWLRVDEALSKYRTRQGIDIEEKRTIEIPLSNNRIIYLSVFEKGLKAAIRTEPFKDPIQHKIKAGKGAVYEVINGKLTEKDFEKINNVLCSLKGEIGNAARAYKKFIRKWIYFTENKERWKKLATLGDCKYIEGEVSSERDAAMFRFHTVFCYPLAFSMSYVLSEIFLDAIYYDALKGFQSNLNAT